MNSNLYSLVYCSRNRIRGTATEVTAEINTILQSSRVNNQKKDVTGALLYNDGNFAQALEGPLSEIEAIFEKVQRDPRHSEVTLLQIGPIESRQFADWSMALAGAAATLREPMVAAAFQTAFSSPAESGGQMLAMLEELVSQDDWILSNA